MIDKEKHKKILKEEEKYKKFKEPAIIISNHKSLIDFPLYMFTFFKRRVRPLVAEITYNKNKPLKTLLKLLSFKPLINKI